MSKLLKLDLYRLKKEKAPLVGILVSVGILILSVIVFSVQGYHASNSPYDYDLFLSPNEVFLQTSSFASNIPLVLFIVTVTFTARDFSNKTIRLKIQKGYSRTKIYFSALFANLIFCLPIILISGLINYFVVYAFNPPTSISGDDVLKMFVSIFYIILYSTFFISLATAATFTTRKTGSAIVIGLGVIFGEAIFSQIIIFSIIFRFEDVPKWVIKMLSIFPSSSLSKIASSDYNGYDILISYLSLAIYIAITNVSIIFNFKRRDIA